VFWQSPRTRKQARPNVSTPTARAAGIAALDIVVDTREQYAYRFTTQQVTTVKRALPCGDYGITIAGQLVAAVERKSLADLVCSLINGKLRYALGELAALPRAAIVVEDRYSQVFKVDWVRPAVVADGLAELQVRWPACRSCSARPVRLARGDGLLNTLSAWAARAGVGRGSHSRRRRPHQSACAPPPAG